jgi:hypothetical protein
VSDHEHRAYEIWDGDSRWAPVSLVERLVRLEERVSELERRAADRKRTDA